MVRIVKLTPILDDEEEIYTITPKGRFVAALACKESDMKKAVNEGDAFDVIDLIWPDMMKIFGLDDTGENIELNFTREFIGKHDLMYALTSEWAKKLKR